MRRIYIKQSRMGPFAFGAMSEQCDVGGFTPGAARSKNGIVAIRHSLVRTHPTNFTLID
jgi:hypothetical protein